MLIVVSTRLLISDRLDGIGRFTCETLRHLTEMRSDDQFVFLFDRDVAEEFIFSDNITPVKLFPPARRPWLYDIWLKMSVNGVLRDLQPDLFFSPDGFLPLNTKTPCLPVIHDLNFEEYPQDLAPAYSRWYRHNFPRFANKGQRIVTVSDYSKADLVRRYGLTPEKIDVVYNAALPAFLPLQHEEVNHIRQQYTHGAPYFLFVGALHPRKNLPRLIEAYLHYRQTSDSQTKLLIVGAPYWKYNALNNLLNQHPYKADVVFTGRLTEKELVRVTAAAHAVTYLPYFEGFGIPIVEGMACGVPVLTSDTTAMPEIGSDAVLYADPFNIQSIVSGLTRIDNDLELRAQLREKSLRRSTFFSWKKTAEGVWTSIERCLTETYN